MGLWLRGPVQILFLIYMLWLQVVLVGCKGKITGRATCESTGLGKPARITCHYGLNVVEIRDVIAVFLLCEKDGKQEKVVECHRFLNNGFDCLPNVGYKLNGNVSDRMIINIPIALPGHEGTYYCEIGIEQAEFQLDSCNLEYQEPNDSTTFAPPSEQDSGEHLEGDAGTRDAKGWIYATIALSVLGVIAVLSALFVIVRWRRRRRCNGGQQETDEDKQQSTTVSLLPPVHGGTDDGDDPCKKDVGHLSNNLTNVKALAGVVSISTKRDASCDCREHDFSIHIGDEHDDSANSKPQYTREVNSAVNKKPYCTEDRLQCGDQSTPRVTDPSSKTPSAPQCSPWKVVFEPKDLTSLATGEASPTHNILCETAVSIPQGEMTTPGLSRRSLPY